MKVLVGETANDLWVQAASALRDDSQVRTQESRDGPTAELLRAVLVLKNPRQRWVLAREPAMNPAFALAEVVWIVNGKRDADFLNFWNPALPQYAGNAPVYSGAYGYRLRQQFGVDQLDRARRALDSCRDTRQVVLQIWDARSDLPSDDGAPSSRDVPCNVCSMVKVRDGRLEWTQIMRSNDLVLGLPHNLVQFTYLQELVAGWLGVAVGDYVHLSDSLHIYERNVASLDEFYSDEIETNNERWELGYSETMAVFGALADRMDAMRKADTTQALVDAVDASSLPNEAQNLLCIVAADAARRKNYSTLADELAIRCTNACLSQAWQRWSARRVREEPTTDQQGPCHP